MIRQQSLVLGQ